MSTGFPALTMIMMRRGLLSEPTNSSGVWAPMMVLPLARPAIKSSTFLVVRLYTATVKPFAHDGEAYEADICCF